MTNNDLLIWWLNQEDTEAISNMSDDLDWPDYVLDSFNSRYGRNGRGRLFVHPSLTTIDMDGWPSQHPNAPYCESAGGVVIKKEDYSFVYELPGLVTDYSLDTVQPSTV